MPAPLDPLELALDLVRIDSTSGREGEVITWMHDFLEQLGWRVQRIPVTPGRDDVLATVDDCPVVTLSTHLDTVPPFIPPRVAGDRLYGRGSCDAKGIAAAMVVAAEHLRGRGVSVALLFVVGEEVSHDGAHAANRIRTTSRILINGEPTESTLALGTKGAVRARVHVEGRAAHSAYPELGHSATHALVHLLRDLDDLPLSSDQLLGDTTINIGTLAGGLADNVVAPSAEAKIMVRVVDSTDSVIDMLRRWAGTRARLDVGAVVPPVRLGSVPGFPTSVVAYATDIPELTAWGTPYLFGPGSIHVAHTDGEYIDIAEMRKAAFAYEEIALRALELQT